MARDGKGNMIRALLILAVVVTAIYLALVAGLIVAESTWVAPTPASPRDYFLYGSTGTELMPLAVFQILPDLFPDQFQPAGPQAGDWVDQFGFVRGQPRINEGLPLGISVSHYRPGSGAPSPVAFVGFNCAVCHTAKIHTADSDNGAVVYGMGNPSLDLVAFGNAIKTSVLDEQRLTLDSIEKAYEARFHQPLGLSARLMTALWLKGMRTQLNAQLPLRDWPFGGQDLRNSVLLPSGPGRNQPMEETIRFLIDRTPTPWPNGGSSKIPCLYQQQRRQWSQFDGTLHDPITRNSLAALGVGATLYNLKVAGILGTLQQSYVYVKDLDGPQFSDVLHASVDQSRAGRGQKAYLQYCGDCHGWPGDKPGECTMGKRQGQVIPIAEIGTDSARVSFRYYDQMGDLIYNFFPAGHPLKPNRSDLRPNPGDPHGYITEPLESVFSHAPYLHNGSVATLAELINLKPRRTVFYRGDNNYDPMDLGLSVPDQPDAKRYYLFDTGIDGNSNRGHDYPWAYHGPGWDEKTLKDLLEYLKTI